jgi:hypothetical protein
MAPAVDHFVQHELKDPELVPAVAVNSPSNWAPAELKWLAWCPLVKLETQTKKPLTSI